MNRLSQHAFTLAVMAVFSGSLVLMSFDATARGGGGHARTSVNRGHANVNRGANVNRNANINRSANVNRNTNINRSANVNVNRNVDVDVNRRWNHPVGTAVAKVAPSSSISATRLAGSRCRPGITSAAPTIGAE